MPQLTIFLFCLLGAGVAAAEESTSMQTLTPEQLENYQFQNQQQDKNKITVTDLSVGQLSIMNNQRRLAKDLLAHKLGIVDFKGAKRDLASLQQLVDRHILRNSQKEEWQAVGVLFGDILASQYHLTWVNFKDDQGVSKALRYRKTENYVFPVTLFTKRIKFDEKINMQQIYNKLEGDINEFIAWEAKPKLPMGNDSR